MLHATEIGKWRRRALWIAALVVLAYAGAVAFLWATQERRVFLGQRMTPERAEGVIRQVPGAREVWLQAADGTRLHAWWWSAAGGRGDRTVLYFGGNAEDVFWRLGRGASHAGWNLLLVDYRGYGRSEGQPGQLALEQDALAWHDHLAGGLAGLAPAQKVLVKGTSLGSYFATYVAAHRPVVAVILVTPFDSVLEFMKSRLPWVPVELLLRHPLHSIGWAASVRVPSLFLLGGADRTIPPQRGRLLHARWGSPDKPLLEIPAANHDNISGFPAYWEALQGFLSRQP